MTVAAFQPKPMKLSVLTAALQELTPRERRDPDPDLAFEEWLQFARTVGAPNIQLSAALHPSQSDVPARRCSIRSRTRWIFANPSMRGVPPACRARCAKPAMVHSYLSGAAKAATRVPPGHPEGYLEAFATIYSAAIADMRRRREGQPALGGYPTVHDGLRGMRFIDAVVQSSRRGGEWLKM